MITYSVYLYKTIYNEISIIFSILRMCSSLQMCEMIF